MTLVYLVMYIYNCYSCELWIKFRITPNELDNIICLILVTE